MKIYKTVPFEVDRLSADLMEMLVTDETLTVHCENIAEFTNARTNAYWERKNKPRVDGFAYEIKTSTLTNTVSVTAIPDRSRPKSPR